MDEHETRTHDGVMDPRPLQRLKDVAPELEIILTVGAELPTVFSESEISRETVWVTMRDGVRLATDLYLPPQRPAPAIVVRTPYGRAQRPELMALAKQGYIIVSQDCRGTGDSEPDHWDYWLYEPEDSYDCVAWVILQSWFDGFVGACGGSYVAATQWCMAAHPRMSAIVPEVGGLGITYNTVRYYMFLNAYARSVGKGARKVAVHYTEMERQMLEETLAAGYYNEPLERPLPEPLLDRYPRLRALSVFQAKRWLWEQFSGLEPAARVELIEQALDVDEFSFVEMESLYTDFGHRIAYGAHSLPRADASEIGNAICAPALMVTGWYDWGLNDALATWDLLSRNAPAAARSRNRLLITPSAHHAPGYHEGRGQFPELERSFRAATIVDLLAHWYAAVRADKLEDWPTVVYYLMGANEWQVATAWPPAEAQSNTLYLGAGGALSWNAPAQTSTADTYTYDPTNPTPTIGGSIVSFVYPAGSVDVSEAQKRSDVLVYTTKPLEADLDVVGPLRFVLYASSSAVDTDFSVRLSDVFPDGRAIQLQSGMLRARYRNSEGPPELLQPGRVYPFDIDLWATANRFKAGHRLRIDISSADFPRFDRNTNLGGVPGTAVAAVQRIYHDHEHPSRLILFVVPRPTT